MVTQEQIKSSQELEKRLEYLQQFGNRSTSYFTLQEGLDSYFIDGVGYIAYEKFNRGITTAWGLFPETFVLSDPICHSKDKRKLLETFIEENPKACFVQISEDTAKHLNDLGYKINQMGVEIHLDIQEYDLKGPEKRNIRQTYNRAKKENISIIESNNGIVNDVEIKKLSDSWKNKKRNSNVYLY